MRKPEQGEREIAQLLQQRGDFATVEEEYRRPTSAHEGDEIFSCHRDAHLCKQSDASFPRAMLAVAQHAIHIEQHSTHSALLHILATSLFF
jgi:hypothetical protein